MAGVGTPFLVVGGTGAGLTASMLPSKRGVESLLVSALPTTSILAKAHVLDQRTMGILADTGVADEIYLQGTPPGHMAASAGAWHSPRVGASGAGSSARQWWSARRTTIPW